MKQLIGINITGVTGFVGSNLFEYLLDHNCEPKAFNLRNSNWKSELNKEATVIIHLAGKAHDLKNSSNPEEYFEVNTKLTTALFDVFLASNCRDFIYFSSVKAVADSTETTLAETAAPNPQTAYGQSKFQAEQYLLSQPLPAGKRVFILRPCMIHGPDNKGNLNLLYQLVSKGIPWPLGAFENQRSFCSIENVCFVINEILDNENIPSGIYNLADDASLSTNNLIQVLGESLGKRAKIVNLSPKVIRSFAKLGDVLPLPLNTERLQKLTESYVVSNEKIVNAIGKPLPVSAKEGLRRTFKSFKR
jgi:nucleoside-diphosphate-sugar epimerase